MVLTCLGLLTKLQIETCRKVENVLKRFDRKGSMIRVLPFHAALDQNSRLSNLKEFRNPQLKSGSLFLVCTDRYFLFFSFFVFAVLISSKSLIETFFFRVNFTFLHVHGKNIE